MNGSGPLAGVKVVEFGNLIAVPYAGMLLADLGADVVKVEPLGGDLGRGFGPYVGGESAFFMAANRGKRSLAIDPTSTEGRVWLDRLVASADVILNNLRHGAMERMGYDEATVRMHNPTVVYGLVAAFGADGPYADRTGIDVVFQAESGMISLTGRPGDPPQKTATTIGDYVAATNAALAVCAALVERHRTGKGRSIEISLRDGLLAVQAGWFAIYFATGAQPDRRGTASPFLAPNQVFPTADGHLALAIVSDRHFHALATHLERPDLVDRYPTNSDRMEAGEELTSELTDLFTTRPTAHWVDRLTGAGLPVGRVLTLEQVVDDPQVIHNEMVVYYEHPVAGSVPAIGSPIRLDGMAARSTDPSPTLGQHTSPILSELGADTDTIARLVDGGAVVVS